MSSTVYEMVNEKILTALEAGVAPWRRPWATIGGPRNLVSNKPYRGINAFLLGISPYSSPYWLTFKQAQTLGGSVRKGEKSDLAVFWKIDRVTDKETGKPVTVPILRYYRVFNLEQCDGVNMPRGREVTDAGKLDDAARIEAAEQVAARYLGDGGPVLSHGGDGAYYRPSADAVQMPEFGAFEAPARYYSTLFHELGHSTGHSTRLARFGVDNYNVHRFGSAEYGREELVAEMTAAYLCGETGILPDTADQSAAYIESWRKVIREDTRAVVVAAGAAQRAADLILGRVAEIPAQDRTEADAEPVAA